MGFSGLTSPSSPAMGAGGQRKQFSPAATGTGSQVSLGTELEVIRHNEDWRQKGSGRPQEQASLLDIPPGTFEINPPGAQGPHHQPGAPNKTRIFMRTHIDDRRDTPALN